MISPADEEVVLEEPLKGILLVEEELNNLSHNKFLKVYKAAAYAEYEDDNAFRLKANAVQDLQEVIEGSTKLCFGYDEQQ